MKKIARIILAVIIITLFIGCTKQQRARHLGGTQTINLPKGEKLLMATWKDDNLFYLTEYMEHDYEPKTKIFRESASFGIVEGKVVFVENK